MKSGHRPQPVIDGRETRHLVEAGIDHGSPFVSRFARCAGVFPAFFLCNNPLSAETLL